MLVRGAGSKPWRRRKRRRRRRRIGKAQSQTPRLL
jgi:hypothetical protein